MNPAFRLEDCPQTADHCYPNTFKTFLIPITKNLKL